jgi:subtilase family serine protease
MVCRFVVLGALAALVVTGTIVSAQVAGAPHAILVVPDTSRERPEDPGHRAHTNHLLVVRPDFTGTSPTGETPASLRAIYGNLPSSGGAKAIAIVDAYHYATADNDLRVFSTQFNLPQCTLSNGCFKQITLGARPRVNCGWGQEAALDIEWAHAMAPNAKIILVEANSNSFSDLFAAVDRARTELASFGGGEVSMSWGGSEFSSEASNDSHFVQSGSVVYFAASGDTGGKTIYPGVSPLVVAAGGTTVHRDKNGQFTGETGWSGSGGGTSQFESRPAYQDSIQALVGTRRGVPDYSFDADPNSGVSVYDSTKCQGLGGWLVFGGTSVSSPALAGIVNLAAASSGGSFAASSTDELTRIYNAFNASTTDFRDITSGTAGSFAAAPGWDFVTGVGSNLGLSGK